MSPHNRPALKSSLVSGRFITEQLIKRQTSWLFFYHWKYIKYIKKKNKNICTESFFSWCMFSVLPPSLVSLLLTVWRRFCGFAPKIKVRSQSTPWWCHTWTSATQTWPTFSFFLSRHSGSAALIRSQRELTSDSAHSGEQEVRSGSVGWWRCPTCCFYSSHSSLRLNVLEAFYCSKTTKYERRETPNISQHRFPLHLCNLRPPSQRNDRKVIKWSKKLFFIYVNSVARIEIITTVSVKYKAHLIKLWGLQEQLF